MGQSNYCDSLSASRSAPSAMHPATPGTGGSSGSHHKGELAPSVSLPTSAGKDAVDEAASAPKPTGKEKKKEWFAQKYGSSQPAVAPRAEARPRPARRRRSNHPTNGRLNASERVFATDIDAP